MARAAQIPRKQRSQACLIGRLRPPAARLLALPGFRKQISISTLAFKGLLWWPLSPARLLRPHKPQCICHSRITSQPSSCLVEPTLGREIKLLGHLPNGRRTSLKRLILSKHVHKFDGPPVTPGQGSVTTCLPALTLTLQSELKRPVLECTPQQ